MLSPARMAAFEILRLVEGGGYASDLLRSRTAGLDPRDAGLASEIVLGSLRYRGQLDYLIQFFSGRDAGSLDAEVRIALRMGIYQRRYLARVPAHAAVDESVEIVKKARKRSAAGFVNAVLRKVHRRPVAWPDRATELSHPAWLLERWDRRHGAEVTDRIAHANLSPPETYVRVPGRLPSGVTLEEEPPDRFPLPATAPVGHSRPRVRVAQTGAPGCYRVVEGSPEGLRIQDIGSQAVVPLLDLSPGQMFLDVCAAPGNKTAQALESGVRAIACDFRWSRLAPMKDLGCPLVVLDGTRALPFAARFDRILVDAPCSGTGTLAHNPEIKWRLKPGQLAELHRQQVLLLRHALECLAPGGRLVYSTCSLEREENEDVVEEAAPSGIARLWRRIPGLDAGDGFFAAVITSEKLVNGSDCSIYFVS